MNIIFNKIDPVIWRLINPLSDEYCKLVLYSNKHWNSMSELKSIGAKINCELPIIRGYIIEIPSNRVKMLANLKNIKYVSADIGIRMQM